MTFANFTLLDLLNRRLPNTAKGGFYENINIKLTPKHRQNLLDLLMPCFRAEWKKEALRNVVAELDNDSLKQYAIFERICFDGEERCRYVAGQDYRGELNYIANLLIK